MPQSSNTACLSSSTGLDYVVQKLFITLTLFMVNALHVLASQHVLLGRIGRCVCWCAGGSAKCYHVGTTGSDGVRAARIHRWSQHTTCDNRAMGPDGWPEGWRAGRGGGMGGAVSSPQSVDQIARPLFIHSGCALTIASRLSNWPPIKLYQSSAIDCTSCLSSVTLHR